MTEIVSVMPMIYESALQSAPYPPFRTVQALTMKCNEIETRLQRARILGQVLSAPPQTGDPWPKHHLCGLSSHTGRVGRGRQLHESEVR